MGHRTSLKFLTIVSPAELPPRPLLEKLAKELHHWLVLFIILSMISWTRTCPCINEMMKRGDIFHCNKFQLGCISSQGIRCHLISIWVNSLELLLCIWYWTWVLFSLISSYWLSNCYAYMSICDWKFVMCIGLCFVISSQVPM